MTQKNSNPPPTFAKPPPPPSPPPAPRDVSLSMYEQMRRERDTAQQALRDMHPGIICEKCGKSKRADEMHSDQCYGCAWLEASSKLNEARKLLYEAYPWTSSDLQKAMDAVLPKEWCDAYSASRPKPEAPK